jgi:hypothetical protein
MVNKRVLIGGAAVLVGLLLVAVIVRALRPDQPSPGVNLPTGVETAVKETLSARTGVPVADIDTVAAEEKEWPNACLGLAEHDEMCAEVLTSGWEVAARAQGQTYVCRTNQDGTQVRIEE